MTGAPQDGDWGRRSRESVAELERKNDAFRRDLDLTLSTAYRWNLDAESIRFDTPSGTLNVPIVCVGSVSGVAGTSIRRRCGVSEHVTSTRDPR